MPRKNDFNINISIVFIFHILIYLELKIKKIFRIIKKLNDGPCIHISGIHCRFLCSKMNERDCKCNFKWPPCKDDNARFTAVPLKVLSDQVWLINVYNNKKPQYLPHYWLDKLLRVSSLIRLCHLCMEGRSRNYAYSPFNLNVCGNETEP